MGQQSSWGAKGRETGYLNLSHLEAVPSGTWPLQDESDQGKPQGLFTSHFCSHCFNHNWSRDSKEAGKGGFLEVLKGKEAMFWWTLFLPHYHWVLRRHKDSSSTQVKTTAWILGMFRHHARHWWFPETSLNDCTPKGALLSWEDRKLCFFFYYYWYKTINSKNRNFLKMCFMTYLEGVIYWKSLTFHTLILTMVFGVPHTRFSPSSAAHHESPQASIISFVKWIKE